MDRRKNQIVLVEIRRAREIAGDGGRIERKLGEKLIACGELLGDPLELDEIAEAHVRRVVNALEMRLEPFTRPRDLPLPGTFGHRKAHHQFSKRIPRFRQSCRGMELSKRVPRKSRSLETRNKLLR